MEEKKERPVLSLKRPKDWEPITHTVMVIHEDGLTNLRDVNEEILKERAEKTRKE